MTRRTFARVTLAILAIIGIYVFFFVFPVYAWATVLATWGFCAALYFLIMWAFFYDD